MRRIGTIVAVVAILVAAGGYGYWRRTGDRRAEGYVTENVDRGPIVQVVTATGTVNPVTTVQVGTYVSGPIIALDVDYNSQVTKGQRVAKIDPAPFRVKVQKAEASLENARAKVDKDHADLKLKKLSLDRMNDLWKRQLNAQNDVDSARSDYDQAVAQVALDTAAVHQAEADVEDAHINLNYTDITSPVDGVVVSRNVDVGQTVAASFQTPTLFLIAQDLTKMQVNANVSESDIGDVLGGQAATFTVDAYPSRLFQGKVVQVRNAPITVQNVVTYDVVVGVDNPDLALKPGMTATITITTAQRDNVLRVPLRALRFNPGRKAAADGAPSATPRRAVSEVWVLRADGTLDRVPIQTGLRNDQQAELLSGDMQAGDQVAVAFRSGAARGPTPPRMGPRFR